MTPKARLNQTGFNKFKEKVILRDEVCQSCGGDPQTAHHFFPQGSYGYLKFNLLNGVAICTSCHFAHHTKGDPLVHLRIIKRRGDNWLSILEEAVKNKPDKYGGLPWMREQINALDKDL